MKNPENMPELAGYIDGELPPSQVDRVKDMADANSGLKQAMEDQEAVKKLLRLNRFTHEVPITGDMMWDRVYRAIEQEERKFDAVRNTDVITLIIRRFWAPAMAACLAIVLFSAHQGLNDKFVTIREMRTPHGVSATNYRIPEAGVTVIWMEGLDYIPANSSIDPAS
ncbi:MAG: hypothetical protein SGI71_07955 [Verrucomicrobiota bacterium]|nr:hypothetical protein [Verrucomicrobiota bacterium]